MWYTEKLHVNNIPIESIISCAVDGSTVMMDNEKSCLKMMKDENPECFLSIIIHRENLISRNITPVLIEEEEEAKIFISITCYISSSYILKYMMPFVIEEKIRRQNISAYDIPI